MKTTIRIPRDPDIVNAEKALIRAGKIALKTARQTGTPCYVYKNGKIVDIAKHLNRKSEKKLRREGLNKECQRLTSLKKN